MKLNDLNKNIKYEWILLHSKNDFIFWIMLAEHKELFNDIDFLYACRTYGLRFWYNAIKYSMIPMNVLFKHFKLYLFNKELHDDILLYIKKGLVKKIYFINYLKEFEKCRKTYK